MLCFQNVTVYFGQSYFSVLETMEAVELAGAWLCISKVTERTAARSRPSVAMGQVLH